MGEKTKTGKLEVKSNREREYTVETYAHARSAPCPCLYDFLRVKKTALLSELEENYHDGNDLPDTSTLTSALTPGRN